MAHRKPFRLVMAPAPLQRVEAPMCLTRWGVWWEQPGDLTASAEMRNSKFIAIFCLFALGAGCGSHPKIRKLRASSVIVAFGDSLTFGTGASPGESYPSVLANFQDPVGPRSHE